MTSVRRRALAAAALTVTASLTLSACSTSFGAQTSKVYQPAVGANHRGEVDVLNTLLVANSDGSATVSAGVVNNLDADQQLTGVSATTLDGTTVPVKTAKSLVPLGAGDLVQLGTQGAPVYRVASGVTAGSYVELTFSFSDAGDVTIEAPVVARTEQYATITGDEGAPSAEPTATEEPAAE